MGLRFAPSWVFLCFLLVSAPALSKMHDVTPHIRDKSPIRSLEIWEFGAEPGKAMIRQRGVSDPTSLEFTLHRNGVFQIEFESSGGTPAFFGPYIGALAFFKNPGALPIPDSVLQEYGVEDLPDLLRSAMKDHFDRHPEPRPYSMLDLTATVQRVLVPLLEREKTRLALQKDASEILSHILPAASPAELQLLSRRILASTVIALGGSGGRTIHSPHPDRYDWVLESELDSRLLRVFLKPIVEPLMGRFLTNLKPLPVESAPPIRARGTFESVNGKLRETVYLELGGFFQRTDWLNFNLHLMQMADLLASADPLPSPHGENFHFLLSQLAKLPSVLERPELQGGQEISAEMEQKMTHLGLLALKEVLLLGASPDEAACANRLLQQATAKLSFELP